MSQYCPCRRWLYSHIYPHGRRQKGLMIAIASHIRANINSGDRLKTTTEFVSNMKFASAMSPVRRRGGPCMIKGRDPSQWHAEKNCHQPKRKLLPMPSPKPVGSDSPRPWLNAPLNIQAELGSGHPWIRVSYFDRQAVPLLRAELTSYSEEKTDWRSPLPMIH